MHLIDAISSRKYFKQTNDQLAFNEELVQIIYSTPHILMHPK